LAGQDAAAAALDLDRGAQQFGDQIGSWIAAGWAHYLAGEVDAAAQRFERALAIDHNFAESHGSLAVIDAARGDNESARRRMQTALRLDRQCFSAVMAKVMLDAASPEEAKALFDQAFNTPLNAQGMTIASYMVGMVRPTLH
ncbi:MAG: tetratricopeptide repeat protein, partial [Novosphingobium sp.]|nr:tetratricopeptide repeat protein [Novosphingobium sp.]